MVLRRMPVDGFCGSKTEDDMMQIKNLAAVVTGGGSGLGAATAAHLATLGAKVAVADINRDAAESHPKAIGGIGISFDVAHAPPAQGALAAPPAPHGPGPLLGNRAGIGT